jgi:hypothetical protein
VAGGCWAGGEDIVLRSRKNGGWPAGVGRAGRMGVESDGWPVRVRGMGKVIVDEVTVSGSGGWRVGVGKLGGLRIVRLKWRVAGGSRRSCGLC